MKYLLIIGDGMADNPIPELGNLTPLQKAHIPAIDRMAARGIVGSTVNCPPSLPAGSETAILSILGCDPRRYFTGRSPMEAAAAGIALRPGDCAFRCNLVTFEDGEQPLEEKRILSHSAGSWRRRGWSCIPFLPSGSWQYVMNVILQESVSRRPMTIWESAVVLFFPQEAKRLPSISGLCGWPTKFWTVIR